MCQGIGWHQLESVDMGEVCNGYHQQHHQPALKFGEQSCWCSQCQVTGKQQEEKVLSERRLETAHSIG